MRHRCAKGFSVLVRFVAERMHMHMGMSVRRRGVREMLSLNRQVFGRGLRQEVQWEMMIRPWKVFKTPMIRCRASGSSPLVAREQRFPAPSQGPKRETSFFSPRQAVRQPVFEPASLSCPAWTPYDPGFVLSAV
ncbi:MAG: hypothetical protein ACLR0N_04455 [Bilophila wadsworthia]